MPTNDDNADAQLQQQQQQMLKLTRLKLYMHTAHKRMNEVFSAYPCLGLHFGFGDSEIERLQKAVQRHGRQDQFDALAVPVDVLLRVISFIPNPADPRTSSTPTSSSSDSLVRQTLPRLACTCSTLLFTIMENKCLLGKVAGSNASTLDLPAESVRRAQKAEQQFRDAEAQVRRNAARDEMQKARAERQNRLHHREDFDDPTYEGLPPGRDIAAISKLITSIAEDVRVHASLLDRTELEKRKKLPTKNFWGKKRDADEKSKNNDNDE